ncbi:hypothetical protein Y032_0229g2898 [Ancylostoma ceylanicum]|uniref:Uncharacterized protein n=1 Tax=Ancylostoma ceylanicum TaxID=53326 RepID=A0A016SH55_9BILA|nr:hypothetical protein Y032_0229g2898 [Ancylostoma ceylanicum]
MFLSIPCDFKWFTVASQQISFERDCSDVEEVPITEEQFVSDGMNALLQRLRIVGIFFSVIIGRDFPYYVDGFISLTLLLLGCPLAIMIADSALIPPNDQVVMSCFVLGRWIFPVVFS